METTLKKNAAPIAVLSTAHVRRKVSKYFREYKIGVKFVNRICAQYKFLSLKDL
jgi:hypothetical protein